MTFSIKEKIHSFFNKGHERTVLAKKNVTLSFLIKGISVLISLFLTPLTIDYVGVERNGIWLTLYSMAFWLNLFDIGLGNGMKNKLAEAKANGDNNLARKYVSSTYAIIGFVCIFIFLLFLIINPYLDWMKILGSVPAQYAKEVDGLVFIFVLAFCFTFVLNLIKVIATSDQRPALGAVMDVVGQVLILIGVLILSKTTPPSLISLGFVTAFAPVLVYLIASIILFSKRYKKWKPSLKLVNLSLAKNMMNLGVKFFIATCAAFLVTYTLPFLILRLNTPIDVTNYNAAFKLFSVGYTLMGFIVFPYWASFTDAYTKKDFDWMKKSIKTLYKFYFIFIISQIIFLLFSSYIYDIWINRWLSPENTLTIPFSLSVTVCIYVSVLCWLNINIYPLNGIGKVNLQVYSSIVEIILLLPISLFLGHLLGTIGIVLTPVIVYLPRIVWAPIQLNKLMNNKATGIWNK
jgi:Membrane protein involved in the export of O-antigen and teichoic acid